MSPDDPAAALRRLAEGSDESVPGPLALDLPDDTGHEWVTTVRIDTDDDAPTLDWHGGHHHRNRITGPIRVDGEALYVPTDLGPLVLRPISPADTWRVYPANVTAWEAHQQGLT